MKKYTLSSYEPIHIDLPKPPVPDGLVDKQIERMLEQHAEYRLSDDQGPVRMGDFIVVTTADARMDGNPAPNFVLEHSVYHVGCGEMPRTFDEAIEGMRVGEKKHVCAEIKLPISPEPSKLTMDVEVEKLVDYAPPVLDDAFVAQHYAPATTVAEFRAQVAGEFGLPDMAKTDPQFPDLLLVELSKRLVEQPDPADLPEGMPAAALRSTCAIDALADHLGIQLTDDQVTAQLPGDSDEQRKKIRLQLKEQGLEDEAWQFARREAALSWLVNKSSVSYQ